MTVDLHTSKCAAQECENKRTEGRFVGDFCAACDQALRFGVSFPGTSILFKLKEDRDSLLAEVQRLQRALAFWAPYVPNEDSDFGNKAADAAMLMYGFNGPDESSAWDLGWVRRGEILT